eukprot:8965216-Karenia_brevis.AAC.1
MGPEVSAKCALMGASLRSFKGRLLHNKLIPITDKAMVVRSVTLSSGCFQCGTWPRLRGKTGARFHAAVMRAYRGVVRHTLEESVWSSDEAVLKETGALLPVNLLALQRILLMCRLAKARATPVVAMLAVAAAHPLAWLN